MITLLTVGKTDGGWISDAIDNYVSRLGHYAKFAMVEIPAVKGASSWTPEAVKAKEGELILSKLKASDEVILLDERGREYRSVEFAAFLEGKLSRGGRDLVFVVGGALGFSEAVYSRADGLLALSKMTFTHQMVRLFFVEQLYRAFTIIRHEPYHNE
ncbi:MAG: 23S rRNA (pseudouridine(1915)-N(3))-methyltransferase RlmH [Bacteroidales bacterium]|nr:23S rRNA (pseudouridine(1915)-N(3))-methyltransferase RlmH [Bacteroidales bacterium]